MTKEELEVKIELIEKNIEFIKEMMAYNKKFDRGIIVFSILAFIFILIVNMENKDISIMTIFSISLFITATYNQFDKMIKEKRDNELNLRQLSIKLSYYKGLLEYK